MSRKSVIIAGLVVAFLIAAVVSGFASGHPDGLEYVAEHTGFAHTATDDALANGPMADYAVSGVDNERLSGGLAGVIGSAAVLLVMGGVVLAIRRRTSNDNTPAQASSTPAGS